MTRQLVPFVTFFVVILGVASVATWSFLPDNGGDIPLTLIVVGLCAALAIIPASLLEARIRTVQSRITGDGGQ